VHADDAEPFTGIEREVEVAEQPLAVAVVVANPVQLDDPVAEAGGAEVQVEIAGAGRRLGATLDDGGGRVDARLGLAGARRRTPTQPGELGAGEVAADRLGGGGTLLSLGAGLEVAGVPAFVDMAGAPVELEDAGGDPVEQVPVVGDED